MNKRKTTMRKMLSLLVAFLCVVGALPAQAVFADSESTSISGKLYEFGEKDHYEYSSAETSVQTNTGNTCGSFSIAGELSSDGTKDGVPSYAVSEGNVTLTYSYTDTLLSADEESWHLVEDKSKQVDTVKLDSNIKFGTLILQTSKDGVSWVNDVMTSNVFKDTPNQEEPFYTTKSVQLANGCYYRLIVAYKTGIKKGQNQVLFVKTDDYEYKKTAEVYEFYLHDQSADQQDENKLSKKLGKTVNTGKDNGYSGSNEIGIKDPHYGWEIGRFYVSGYTRETDDKGQPVFLKNVGDQITLWFNLTQDIDRLNNNENLSINDDKNGYDQYFQIEKTDFGRGTLIIRYIDERGDEHDPEIYTNYLEANATTGADTIVKLFEEGDYEVALDYEIKETPRKVGNIEVVPEYTNYRIFFKFSVRNGNCMVYPFDLLTGAELANEAITPNGFKLDMAKSRYLTIDVQRSVVTQGANGYVEDVRFNRPAKDGDEYTDEGIYTFSVNNLYTGESTEKKIYVGSSNYMQALSVNKLTVEELNVQIDQGATISDDGELVMPAPTEEPTPTEEPSVEPTKEPESEETADVNESEDEDSSSQTEAEIREETVDDNTDGKTPVVPIAVGAVAAVGVVAAVLSRKKKKDD